MTAHEPQLHLLSAVELGGLLRTRAVSAREVLACHLDQVERVNPAVNAVVTLTAERAVETARRLDELIVRDGPVGVLHGIPVAHKDLAETRGVRTTYGSPLYADHVPDFDAAVVERMAAAGAVSIGKTNTPEFGAGSQTFNPVFGATRNPYDHARTAGGSSGGAAAALATCMVALADGSDLGGSLRNPASFCNVVGFRPTAGLVSKWPTRSGWFPMDVTGPMARGVEDVALLLSAIAGDDPRLAQSLPVSGASFAPPLGADVSRVRVAWNRDLGGLPVSRDVTAVLEGVGRPALTGLGWEVEDVEVDFAGAEEAFRTWRSWYQALSLGDVFEQHPEMLKADLRWEIARGLRVTGGDLARAEVLREALYGRVQRLMGDYDLLALPVAQVPPFPVELPWVTEIEGVPQGSYLDWMRAAYFVSVTGLPAISVPCGFTAGGLPVGIQLVGRPRGDRRLLELAYAVEQATGASSRRPPPPDRRGSQPVGPSASGEAEGTSAQATD